jgi:predicted kinase
MEDLLRSHKALEDCYKQYSLDQIREMTPEQLKGLCLKERIQHSKDVVKMNIQDLINERIAIMKMQIVNASDARREKLKNFYKL